MTRQKDIGAAVHVPPVAPNVAAVVATYPEHAQAHLGGLRHLIFTEADRLKVGPLTETLKWGEPAYLTEETRTGTTLRLAWKSRNAEVLQMLVHCQTNLIETWRDRFPNLRYNGNRAVHLSLDMPLQTRDLLSCISMALTYHRHFT